MRMIPLSLLLLLSASPVVRAAPPNQVTQVYSVDGELAYVGKLDKDANKRLFALYESLQDKPKALSIRSLGGAVLVGIELGNWLQAHKLDVKVMEYCLSSCANYVFPAGKRKIVSNFAVIGFHGGAKSTYVSMAAASKKALADKPQEVKQMAALMIKDLQAQATQEEKYFKAIGVQQDMVSRGQESRHLMLYKDNPKAVGWTYSADDFARLGVGNIVVVNPPWSPKLISHDEQFPILALERVK